MYIKILIIIFIVCIILICLKNKLHNNDIFYNLDQFRKEYKNINSKFDNFLVSLNKIYLKNEIRNGDIEFSSKISFNNINSDRVVYFIPVQFFNKLLINDIKQIDDINEDSIDKIADNIKQIKYTDARVGIGYDDVENTKRLYFSYKQQKSIGLVGYNIDSFSIKEKVYKIIKKDEIKDIIHNNFGQKLLDIFTDTFPEYLWDITGAKIEKSHKNIYIGLNYEYLLQQFMPNFEKLLIYFYGVKDNTIKKWIETYKIKNILWISLGYDYKQRETITFYFIYDKTKRSVFNMKNLKLFSNIF